MDLAIHLDKLSSQLERVSKSQVVEVPPEVRMALATYYPLV